MELSLTAIRVIGSLMEKARTTPEVYPLTLNSLVNACNQKTSRDPVTDYDEDEVMAALDELREKHLAMRVDVAGSRSAKFRENIATHWELDREEYALLAVLLLRGPQTPGQLRQRCERMYPFAELQQVTDRLQRMQKREEEPHCLVRSIGKAHGAKEIRYAHTLSSPGESVLEESPPASSPEAPAKAQEESRPNRLEERLDRLEKRMQDLENLLNELTS